VDSLGYVIVAVGAYLLGSIPTGFLVAKAKGIDIRTVGSGNIGATNVFRILGKPAGIFVLLFDAFKGWAGAAWVSRAVYYSMMKADLDGNTLEMLSFVGGFGAVLGHNYTCWLNFKGGKGIATSAGVLVALVPWALLIALGVWIAMFATTRYVSVGSIVAAVALPFATWFTTHKPSLAIITGVLSALAIYKHKANIQRLLNGTENRFGAKKTAPSTPPPSS